MKESLSFRLTLAIACTFLSSIGLAMSFREGCLLYLAAWAAYFLILYFWVKDNRAPKLLMVTGTVLGCMSVFSTLFFAMILVLTFPAIALMVYVLYLSFKDPENSVQQHV